MATDIPARAHTAIFMNSELAYIFLIFALFCDYSVAALKGGIGECITLFL